MALQTSASGIAYRVTGRTTQQCRGRRPEIGEVSLAGQPRFLVDVDASRGNSGSPVFLCSTGKLAGIVFAQASDTIRIIDAARKTSARVPYGASLAACIPASAIREFLEAR